MEIDTVTKRTARSTVRLSFSAESILSCVLGGAYLGCHGSELMGRRWNKLIKNLFSKLALAINLNLKSDGIHRRKIDRLRRMFENALKQGDNVDCELVLILINLCFELLGDLPDNRKRRYANKNAYLLTDQKRSLQYHQTALQKYQVIRESGWSEPFKHMYTPEDILQKYCNEFNGRPLEFINWYKETYPKFYADLF